MATVTTQASGVMGATEEGSTEQAIPGMTPVEQAANIAVPTPPVAPERTLKVIQAELIERGFPSDQVKGLQSKAVAQAVLDSMANSPVASTTTTAVPLVKVDTLDEKLNPREEKQLEKQYLTKRDIIRSKLEAQAQVPIFIQKSDSSFRLSYH